MQEKNYYNEIKEKLLKDESYSKIKDYSKERHRVMTYFQVGKILSEAGKHYGEDIIGNYSEKLIIDVDKKFNKRTLFRMRQFYEIFSNEKVSTMSTQLTWSHYTELLSIKDITERNYYLNRCINQPISIKQLRKLKMEKEYERLPEETK